VAIRGKALGMEILAYDPYLNEELAKADGAKGVDLDTLLAESDILSIHLPTIPSCKAIVNKDWFSKMKKTAWVINTARAYVIDQKDFIEALQNGDIAGAAVDVYWKEPVPANHPLLQMRNVLCTPHMAGLTTDVDGWSGRMMAEEVNAYLEGKPGKYLWKVRK
jgi:D-3-phosphoglycerate dehydrogenase